MNQTNQINERKGFTLIELAIVLVVIGLLLGMGLRLIGPLVMRAKLNEVKETLKADVESILGFASKTNRIPTTSEFPTSVRTPKDTWGRDIYYIPDSNLTTATYGGICERGSASITVKVCPDAACRSPKSVINNVAFVVISGGANLNTQTGITRANVVNVYTADIPNIDDYRADINRRDRYDDIVKWIVLDELRIKAGCSGQQINITNNELPSGLKDSAYNATIFADGGITFASGGKYRWCREGIAPAGLTFSPNIFSSNCSSLSESSWGQRDNLDISGTPTQAGSFNLTFYVRDNNDQSGNNDNIAKKSFVLTISSR